MVKGGVCMCCYGYLLVRRVARVLAAGCELVVAVERVMSQHILTHFSPHLT